ncbi:ParB/RepB/Spo0J family partition protein [Amycolatopsis sp. QT-25]|uniref:ParB/RepB/Spo0J family partition protein n=1 Tax=Amycolatopsis sp. QT-25 TaxID=3034022 RepID=UPI0023EC7571|nr:ParB/RepB/Spo0J family partition protein [Amycolatopsis sp. QT-25]WET81651.1 ParB/RepB/Spo0J family partition protein [Amycolatopsis sp. QT-25]
MVSPYNDDLTSITVFAVPVDLIYRGDSPRLAGEDGDHVRTLADSDSGFPPIVVHRASMRVIDGMHRLQAAILSGRTTIDVRYFDGDDDAAFLLGVELNVMHGMPLTLGDRTAAARRILVAHPEWSDRMIASSTALATRTVRTIRSRSSGEEAQSNVRVGRDGRVRPVNSAAARRLAGRLLVESPNASLREIARAVGVAPSTVHDVRTRIRSGQDPVPPGQRESPKPVVKRRPAPPKRADPAERLHSLERLRRDPSLRFTEAGRTLLKWLDRHLAMMESWNQIVDQVPVHCAESIAELAYENAEDWRELAANVAERGKVSWRGSSVR